MDQLGHGVIKHQSERAALLDLLRHLRSIGYRFTTATPATHARVVSRPDRKNAQCLRDVLGWSLPFDPAILSPEIMRLLEAADVLVTGEDGRMGATVRVSSVLDNLFLHSAFPTSALDSVFLGPDSYRFADYIVTNGGALPDGGRILDYGAGAGVGGISAACIKPRVQLVLADINPKALFLASINAEFAGIDHVTVEASSPREMEPGFDLIVTHPPFMMDSEKRAYRDGGGLYGAQLSLDWVLAGIDMLVPGGRLIVHTGISIVAGRDVFLEQIDTRLAGPEWAIDYHELDPDIFSEHLDEPAYAEVERIAAVGLCVTRRSARPGETGQDQ